MTLPNHYARGWTDDECLDALHLCYVERFSRAQAALIMTEERGRLITKNAVIGAIDRIRLADVAVKNLATKPENMNVRGL